MNTKLLQTQESLLAIATKTTQRSSLFLQSCTLIQEQQAIIQRLAQHIGDLDTEIQRYEAERTTPPTVPAVPTKAPGQP